MKTILTLSMRDEIEHVNLQLDNALGLGVYDVIIILDDGSKDGTYDVLKSYATNYNNIELYRNEHNSVLHNKENRWYTLYKHAAKHEPTWINHRAADVIYPLKSKDKLAQRLQECEQSGICMITFPFVNIWRSATWYRADGVWGQWVVACDTNIYRFNKNAIWARTAAGVHLGATKPDDLGFTNAINVGINSSLSNNFIVGLHLAHTTHEKLIKRFEWYMEVASKSKNIALTPPPSSMPHPSQWGQFNSYKIFNEYQAFFKKGPDYWFDDPIPNEPTPPKPRSLYDTIKKYNITMAEEYKKLFEAQYGNN